MRFRGIILAGQSTASLQEMRPNSLVEAIQESLDLILDRVFDSIRHNQANVFCLVLLCNRDLCAALFQLDHLLLSKLIVFDRELLLQIVSQGDTSKRS